VRRAYKRAPASAHAVLCAAPINARLQARMPALLVDACLALLEDCERLIDDCERFWRRALKRNVHPTLKMQ